jgi:hypothetical protein
MSNVALKMSVAVKMSGGGRRITAAEKKSSA